MHTINNANPLSAKTKTPMLTNSTPAWQSYPLSLTMTAIQRQNGNSLEEAEVLVGLDDYSMHACPPSSKEKHLLNTITSTNSLISFCLSVND
jgi:hypothetical protein